MNVLILLFATLLISGYSMILKFAADTGSTLKRLLLFDGLFCAVACIPACILTATSAYGFYIPAGGVLVSLLYGVTFVLTVVFNLLAIVNGPLSLVTLIVNLSLVIPVTYSIVFGNESFSPVCFCGLFCFFVCTVLLTDRSVDGNTEGNRSARWLLFAIAAALCNGLGTTLIKVYLVKTNGEYVSPLNFYSYLVAAAFSFVLLAAILLIKRDRIGRDDRQVFFSKKMMLLILLIGVFNFGGNYLVSFLADKMNAAAVYPVVQGGSIIITAVISRIFLKEPISIRKWIAIGVGTLSVVLLSF